MSGIDINSFVHKQDKNGYYWNKNKKCYMLKGVEHPTDKTRNEKAAEQAAKEPVSFSKVYSYTNEFLEAVRKDNGFKEEIIRVDSIKLGEKEGEIIDNGIIIRDIDWTVPHLDKEKRTYDTYDEKYDVIATQFDLERVSDVLWFKFTNYGHLAVVASSCDINWDDNTSCGFLVNEIGRKTGERFDKSFVFVFPLTQQMVRTKDDPKSRFRKYSKADLERAVGNYLIDKGVPIIDYFSHMGGKWESNESQF